MPRMSSYDLEVFLAKQGEKQAKPRSISEDREAVLHGLIKDECERRRWIALHGRMDKPTGRTPGEPDFVILAAGRVYFVECKAGNNKLSEDQFNLACRAKWLGHTIHVVRSYDEFLKVVNR